mmetsp:Transcript_26623/g.26507  ORF Transcript_26623/g.26507 Transcript_26623/m.26507 type:complete len:251 (-) Transcript_26623:63-815(-)
MKFGSSNNDNCAFASGFRVPAVEFFETEKKFRKMIREDGENSLDKMDPDQFVELLKEFSPESKSRIRQIKYHFRAILDTILCSPEKCLVFISGNISDKSKADYEQLLQLPKGKALDLLKDGDFKLGDRLLYEGKVSSHMRDMILKTKDSLNEAFSLLREDVRTLVKVRNSLFKNLQKIGPSIDFVRNTQAKSKDILNFLRYYEKTENNPAFSIYNLCGVKRRKTDEPEPDTDVYMTDDDKMSLIESLNGT